MTDLRSDKLLEEVRQALKAEGCCAGVEIVKLLGAAPGQRNWEIATIGPNPAPPEVRRCIADVQTRGPHSDDDAHCGRLPPGTGGRP